MFNRKVARRAQPAGRKPGRFAGRELERLESRVVLSFTAGYDAATRTLSFLGTDARDVAVIATNPASQVTLNGEVVRVAGQDFKVGEAGTRVTRIRTFDPESRRWTYETAEVRQVESVVVQGGGGDDEADLRGLTQYEGPATVGGGAGNDRILGTPHGAILDGGPGNDTLQGGQGPDELRDGDGDDWLEGGGGDDLYQFAPAAGPQIDRVVEHAGGGYDRLGFAALPANTPVTVALSQDNSLASHANRSLRTGGIGQAACFEAVTGGAGNDLIVGNAADNYLEGGPGDDSIHGLGGNDRLSGGAGYDSLYDRRAFMTGGERVSIEVDGGFPQDDSWSCGPNSATRLLRNYGFDVTYPQLRQMVVESQTLLRIGSLRFSLTDLKLGVTPDALLGLIKRFKGDVALERKVGFDRVLYHLGAGKPVIALVKVGEVKTPTEGVPLLHYVVLTGFDRATATVTCMDTNGRSYTEPESVFRSKWEWSDGGISGAALGVLGVQPRTLIA